MTQDWVTPPRWNVSVNPTSASWASLFSPFMLSRPRQLSSGPVILLRITLELSMLSQDIWRRVLDMCLFYISPSNIFPRLLLWGVREISLNQSVGFGSCSHECVKHWFTIYLKESHGSGCDQHYHYHTKILWSERYYQDTAFLGNTGMGKLIMSVAAKTAW